jgi:hypothetical protein
MKMGKIVKKDKEDSERPVKVDKTPINSNIASRQSYDRDYEQPKAVSSSAMSKPSNKPDSAVKSRPDSVKRSRPDNEYYNYTRNKADEYSDLKTTQSNDYKALYEKQKEEMGMLMDREKNYKREIDHLRRELDENKRHNGGASEANKRLKEVESEKETLMLKILEFIKKTSKYVPYNYSGDKISVRDIEKFLVNLDSFLVKLITDNKSRSGGGNTKSSSNNLNNNGNHHGPEEGKLLRFNEVIQQVNNENMNSQTRYFTL